MCVRLSRTISDNTYLPTYLPDIHRLQDCRDSLFATLYITIMADAFSYYIEHRAHISKGSVTTSLKHGYSPLCLTYLEFKSS